MYIYTCTHERFDAHMHTCTSGVLYVMIVFMYTMHTCTVCTCSCSFLSMDQNLQVTVFLLFSNSLSSNDMVAMSPPPDPPTILPSTFKNFKSPSLAIEVAEALGQSDATPTQSRSQSVTPIPIEEQEKEQLLDNASTDDDLVGVVTDRSTSDKSGYTMVPRDEGKLLPSLLYCIHKRLSKVHVHVHVHVQSGDKLMIVISVI